MTATPVKKVPIHLQSSQNRLIIKNGKIVNADGVSDGDIYIEDGVIKELGRNLIIPGGTRAIDAKGKFVFPGGIDPHTHLESTFLGKKADDFYQGTKAAIAGGTTMVIDFFSNEKDQSLMEAYHDARLIADDKVCCDYSFHAVVKDCNERVKKEMEILMGEEFGINSFKFFMAYKDLMLSDSQLFELFETCRKIGALAMVHAENGQVIMENTKRLLNSGVTGPIGHALSRPEDVEAEAVTRATMIANQTSCPLYIVHVMSRAAAEAVALARSRGNVVFGETLAAALGTNGTNYRSDNFEHAAGHVLSPPLRFDPDTQETMVKFLVSNGLQLTGSDHCTYSTEQKAAGKNDFSLIPNGVNGVEERFSIVWEFGVKTGLIDLPRFVELTSTNAAKIFNLYPRKGVIAVGSDADLVIWDPNQTRKISKSNHHSACNFNIFEGIEIHGAPEYVIVNGRVCVDEFELKAVQGYGKFIPTAAWCPYVYEIVKSREEQTQQHKSLNLTEIKISLPKLAETPRPQVETPASNGQLQSSKDENFLSSHIQSPSNAPSTGRQMRQEGQRDLQGSTFSVSGEKNAVVFKSGIRVHNPPGGQSSGGFW
ncbi:hypothetical protein RUM44_001080 [Polyplax serrata]|uniref:dihydropyrimidinase n=1 Tax=Polyplax serrata TaxID=468196 RepID=A0ABR1B9F5_POLSC